MKNSNIPVGLLNNEHEILADVECDGCGVESPHGHHGDNGGWYCSRCYLEREDNVEYTEQSAVCECGNETQLKRTYANDHSRFVCPCCLEIFGAEPCPECGGLCDVQHTYSGVSACRQCVDEKREEAE